MAKATEFIPWHNGSKFHEHWIPASMHRFFDLDSAMKEADAKMPQQEGGKVRITTAQGRPLYVKNLGGEWQVVQ